MHSVILAMLIGATDNMTFWNKIPENELQILSQVADEYELDWTETKLLVIIRRIENGRSGCEMGVEVPQAMRFKGDFEKSLRLQAQWAAGTIKKRYDGVLSRFAQRWCPVNAGNWYRMARSMLAEN